MQCGELKSTTLGSTIRYNFSISFLMNEIYHLTKKIKKLIFFSIKNKKAFRTVFHHIRNGKSTLPLVDKGRKILNNMDINSI